MRLLPESLTSYRKAIQASLSINSKVAPCNCCATFSKKASHASGERLRRSPPQAPPQASISSPRRGRPKVVRVRPRRVWSTCGRPPLHCCGGELRVRPPATAERAVARSDKMRSILERVGPNEVRSHESTKNGSVCEPFFVHEVKSPPAHGYSIDIVFNHSLRHPLSIQPVIWTRDRK